jgi:hypothetical protein
MNLYEVNIFHQNKLNEDLLVEEFAGVSIYRVNSNFIYSADKYSQGNNDFNAGAKFNFYDAKITNGNSEIQFFFHALISVHLFLVTGIISKTPGLNFIYFTLKTVFL